MKKKGSALLTTVMIVVILMVISISVIGATTSTSITNSRVDDAYNLKLLAESGIAKGFCELKDNYTKFAGQVHKEAQDVGINDPSFNSADNKFKCTIRIYNYDINNTSDETKYTIQAVASTIDDKRPRTLLAYSDKKYKEPEVREDNFFDFFTQYAISLMPKEGKPAIDAKGSENHNKFLEPDPSKAYIQGDIVGNIQLSPGLGEVAGDETIPQILTSEAKNELGVEQDNDTWFRYGSSGIEKDIFIYKANGNVSFVDLYKGIENIKPYIPNSTADYQAKFLASDVFVKIIFISGEFNIDLGEFTVDQGIDIVSSKPNKGKGGAGGNIVKLGSINNCIIICNGSITTDKVKNGAMFDNSSICSGDSLHYNKFQMQFGENFTCSDAARDIIKTIVESNLEKDDVIVSPGGYTDEPTDQLKYID